MQLLSIETTSNFGSIAILENRKIKREIFFESSDIAGELVEKLNYVYDDFNYIVVSLGPGSWTGIRIGISFAKGLACGKKEKIYCVNIFESFFHTVKEIKDKFLCIVPLSKDSFYYSEFNGIFKYEKSFKIKTITFDELISIVKKRKYVLIGPGVLNLKEKLSIEEFKTLEFLWYPRASLNGIVAYEKIKRGISSLPQEPIYGK